MTIVAKFSGVESTEARVTERDDGKFSVTLWDTEAEFVDDNGSSFGCVACKVYPSTARAEAVAYAKSLVCRLPAQTREKQRP